MKRTIVATALLLSALVLAGFGGQGTDFGRLGAGFGRLGKGGGSSAGDILLVDGASFILQTDGTSLICRAGGC